jgi:hypothetical protein
MTTGNDDRWLPNEAVRELVAGLRAQLDAAKKALFQMQEAAKDLTTQLDAAIKARDFDGWSDEFERSVWLADSIRALAKEPKP